MANEHKSKKRKIEKVVEPIKELHPVEPNEKEEKKPKKVANDNDIMVKFGFEATMKLLFNRLSFTFSLYCPCHLSRNRKARKLEKRYLIYSANLQPKKGQWLKNSNLKGVSLLNITSEHEVLMCSFQVPK